MFMKKFSKGFIACLAATLAIFYGFTDTILASGAVLYVFYLLFKEGENEKN